MPKRSSVQWLVHTTAYFHASSKHFLGMVWYRSSLTPDPWCVRLCTALIAFLENPKTIDALIQIHAWVWIVRFVKVDVGHKTISSDDRRRVLWFEHLRLVQVSGTRSCNDLARFSGLTRAYIHSAKPEVAESGVCQKCHIFLRMSMQNPCVSNNWPWYCLYSTGLLGTEVAVKSHVQYMWLEPWQTPCLRRNTVKTFPPAFISLL